MSEEEIGSPVTLSLETVFDLMSDRRRRYTLYVLVQADGGGIYLDDVADQLSQLEAMDDRSYDVPTETYLRESCLPTLADTNVIDYDPRTDAIHYWHNASLEEWIEHAAFKEDKIDW